MTQMMQFAPTFSAFTSVPALALTDGMVAQAIAGTQITADSILEYGQRRDTTIQDIIELSTPIDFVIDPSATKGSYQWCSAKNATLILNNTTIAQVGGSVNVVILHKQGVRVVNEGDRYVKVYSSRFGPTPTTGKPVQHLGESFRLGPREHLRIS